MSYQQILDELRDELGVFRTVLRLDTPGQTFPAVAESLGPGAVSDLGPLPYDLSKVETVQWLMREKRILVQNDCRVGPPHPPPSLIEEEGVGAQMLAPIVRDGEVIGVVAMHHAGGPREWTPADVAAAEKAVERVRRELEQGGW